MADYPILAPTLAALGGVKDLPQGAEAASKLDDVDRQTRNWIYDFLSIYIDTGTGKIKSSAFASDGSLPPGIVRGTNPVDSSQREIAQGTVGTLDLRDDAVTTSKILDGTILNGNIADGTIQGAKLAAATITSDKVAAGVLTTPNIADGSVTDPKIALGTITGQRLAGGTITNDKMAGRSALGPQLPVATVGQILVGGNGPGADEVAPKTLSGALQIDAAGVVVLSSGLAGSLVTFARVIEEAPNATGGGTSGAAVWNRRGSGTPCPPWKIQDKTRDFLELLNLGGAVGGGVIAFKESGRYLVQLSAPAHAVGEHKLRLTFQPNPAGGASTILYYGTSEWSAQPGGVNNNATRSFLNTILSVQVTSDIPTSWPYFYIDHYTQNAVATVGLGKSTSAGVGINEIYGDILIFRVQEDIVAAT